MQALKSSRGLWDSVRPSWSLCSLFPTHSQHLHYSHGQELYKGGFTAVAEMWVGALDNTVVDKAKYLEALAKDPVTLGHDIIHIIHLSGQHRKGFHDTIINGNANQWYTSHPTQVSVIELLRNVRTCWDSIYFMINSLHLVCLLLSVASLSTYFLTRLLTASSAYLVVQMTNLFTTSWCPWSGKFYKIWKLSLR